MITRYVVSGALLLGTFAAGFLAFQTPMERRVGLSAPLELWADTLRDTSALMKRKSDGEKQLGMKLARLVPVDPPIDPGLQPRINGIGARIAAQASRQDIPYTFTVREDSVANAFALPGGHIYINTGLISLTQSDDEIAIVLGHEVSHTDLRHTSPNLIRSVLSMGYASYQEFDADEAGVLLAARAGFNPRAAISLFQRMQAQQPAPIKMPNPRSPVEETGEAVMESLGTVWQSHPNTSERVRRVSNTIVRSNL